MRFKGKVVLVTGAGRGIGKEIALSFAREGAKLALFDLNEEGLKQVKQEIDTISQAEYFLVNVTDLQQVIEGVNKIIDKFSRVDILINNAGITRDNLLLRLKEEDWDSVLSVNLKGAFTCSKAVARIMMKQRSGKIVNISSVIALMGNIGQANYGASKAGLIGLTKSLAKELASRNICVNAVAPGYIQTAMTDKLPEEVKNKMLEMIPLKRFGTTEEISKTLQFIIENDYVTGRTLEIDGGLRI
jgi:3-oxoacyl-[acyl-carrier protein] reductase